MRSDIDAERDALIGSLAAAGQLVEVYQVSGVGSTPSMGAMAKVDRYHTDGDISLGVVIPARVR